MKEVASLFLVIEEVVALGISVQMRQLNSRKPSAQKCVKLLSLFLFRAFARFGDSLPLHHSGHREGGKADHRRVHD